MTTGPYVKLVLSGTLDGVQDWSIGLACQCETDPTADEIHDWLGTVEDPLNTYWALGSSVRSYSRAGFLLSKLSGFGYNEIGTPAVSSAEDILASPLAGASTDEAPSQCSIVHSLKTGYTGRHNSGRTYWPMSASPGLTANRLSVSQCQGLATAWAGFLNDLSTLTVNGTTTSAVFVPSSGTTESRFVSAVEVGDIVDTQRRRRDKYLEVRQTADL